MGEVQVTLTDLRQRLGEFVNRAAYRGERILLLAHGEVKAAIIGVDDLRILEQAQTVGKTEAEQWQEILAEAVTLRERVRAWQTTHGVAPTDSTTTLHELRETYGKDPDLRGCEPRAQAHPV